MLIISELKWAGRAWPAAEIVGSTSDGFAFGTTGKGRPVDLIDPAAWWRNFSEINLDDPAAVIGFVRRRGDPLGKLSKTARGDWEDWPRLASVLELAASCWTRNRAGPSLCARRHGVMEMLVASPLFYDGVGFEPHVDFRGDLGVRIVAKSLAAFMTTSAIIHLQNRIEMAVCQQCGDWFELFRRDTKFCSASCRAACATSKKGNI